MKQMNPASQFPPEALRNLRKQYCGGWQEASRPAVVDVVCAS